MLLATALALLVTGCAQQTFTVQNKPAAKLAQNHRIISSFLELGRKKTVDAAHLWRRRKSLKQKPSKHS